jgi:hypothetical protein
MKKRGPYKRRTPSSPAVSPSVSPPPTPRSEVEIISDMIEHLGIESPLSVAFSPLPKGWRSYIAFAAQAAKEGDAEMIRYMRTYNSLSDAERLRHSPETIADMAQVQLEDLMAAVVKMTFRYCRIRSSLATAVHEPRVIESTALYAKHKDGNKDRELLLKVSGALPTPKGSTTNINVGAYAATRPDSGTETLHLRPAASDIEEFEQMEDQDSESDSQE